MDSVKQHPTYTIVTDPKEADAVGWGFYDHTCKPHKIYFKFPTLKDDEVRIATTYAGLCYSEVHTVRGDWGPITNFPIIPGHEIAGVVTHIGAKVTDFKLGERVGFGCYRDFCGECKKCKRGNDNFCHEVDQTTTYGELYWGGYATAVQHKAKLFFKLPDSLPDEVTPPIFCAGVTTYNPVQKYCKKGDEVGIIGIGGVGHMAVKYAKAWGCTVTAITSSSGKEEFLKSLGADKVIVVTDPDNLKSETTKFDVLMNSAPLTKSEDFVKYLNLLDTQGTWVQLGAPDVKTSVALPLSSLPFQEYTICGSQVGPKKIVQETLEFSSEHKLYPLCEQFEFDDFPKAWDHLINGRPKFRCVIKCKDVLKKE